MTTLGCLGLKCYCRHALQSHCAFTATSAHKTQTAQGQSLTSGSSCDSKSEQSVSSVLPAALLGSMEDGEAGASEIPLSMSSTTALEGASRNDKSGSCLCGAHQDTAMTFKTGTSFKPPAAKNTNYIVPEMNYMHQRKVS